MAVFRHLVSAISLTWITTNLVFWCIPLATIVLLRLAVPPLREASDRWVEQIYRAAVRVDSFWLERVLGIEIRTHGEPAPAQPQQLIVVSNHRSWFDILVVQHVISWHGPTLKFLIKRQLIFVPVVGWICLALNFPRLYRGTSETGRAHDRRSIEQASRQLLQAPYALLNFAEGTRFTHQKRDQRGSDYQHLLNPKSSGLRIIMDSLKGVDILDLTLVYPRDNVSFWQMLGGGVGSVDVFLQRTSSMDINDPADWLKARWREKDAIIESARR